MPRSGTNIPGSMPIPVARRVMPVPGEIAATKKKYHAILCMPASRTRECAHSARVAAVREYQQK